MEPFKIRMSSEDDIKAGVRSAELEADWECSFSVFIHFSQTQEPRVAAVFLLLQTWPPIHNGSDSNLWITVRREIHYDGDGDMYV